jgi:hypothetical protein
MKLAVTIKYECPWCGVELENPQELDKHAKSHYITCISSTV